VIETAYHVQIVLALCLPGITISYYSRIFAFYVQYLTIAGVSQQQSFTLQGKFEFHKSLEVIY